VEWPDTPCIVYKHPNAGEKQVTAQTVLSHQPQVVGQSVRYRSRNVLAWESISRKWSPYGVRYLLWIWFKGLFLWGCKNYFAAWL